MGKEGLLAEKRLNGKAVAFQAETAYYPLAHIAEERVAAVFLAGEDVADVHLDNRRGDGGNGIMQRHAGVAVAPGVEDYAIRRETHLVQPVDQLALHIALVVAYLSFRETGAKRCHHLFF